MAKLHGLTDKTFDHFKIAAEGVFIGLLVKAFEVDIHSVDAAAKTAENAEVGCAVGDKDSFQSFFFGKYGSISYKLKAYQRFVIGEGDADISVRTVFLRSGDKLFGGGRVKLLSKGHSLLRPGDLVVLAEGTSEVTAEASDREDH